MKRTRSAVVALNFITALALVLAPAPRALAQRAPVEAKHGMVASVHDLASEAGVEILKKGGNAVDAGVAVGLALTVVYPFAGNIGGGGFMMIHLADGRAVAIDYRETAPAASGRDMYLGPDGNVLKPGPGSSTVGWRASGVPGSVAGFALAQQKYGSGKVSWADVCEPARRLAADGFVLSQGTAANLKAYAKLLSQFPESKRIFLADGAFHEAGTLWRQPDLAAVFARLQKNGPREFYEGETARLIADAMAKNGGTITLADLKGYAAVERKPLRGTYRGHEIVTMPPPSSGGIALLQMLGMLETHDVAKLGANSAAKFHLFIEVMRRAFRDRAEFLGDPDFVNVPTAGLLDRAYIAGLMKNFNPAKATPSDGLAPGNPAGWTPIKVSQLDDHRARLAAESTETTHYSIVDAAGNAVSNTYTLNGGYGSGVTIPGTGILMNNEMDDFTSKIGVKNMFGLLQGPANAIAPGKRPLSSMTPTFVLKDGALLLVTGSPGGPTIINTVLQVITNVIDHQMPVMQAVEFPRFHHQWQPNTISHDRFSMSPDTSALLTAMGHSLNERPNVVGGDAETVMIDPETKLRLGAADPRKPDAKAVGY
ncbi:MAG: gamma-glutamyltransferase [Opitutia bacterium Tous-C4FEB]|jgi:gamma-glutamyltranspeptidase / glutathione hydrolase|nr:MAG: gamma-glutamyltransferase [Opitutae bacterium Tous-C5TDCM]PAW88284.1 MAG: gamma-glutamyltransferase [Opitutae bacterium Tous-C4FEB]